MKLFTAHINKESITIFITAIIVAILSLTNSYSASAQGVTIPTMQPPPTTDIIHRLPTLTPVVVRDINVPTERFAGTVIDKQGNPLAAAVTINGHTANVASDGSFVAHVPRDENQSYRIKATMPGYAPISYLHTGIAVNDLRLQLSQAQGFAIDPNRPIDVEDAAGTQIVIPANSLVGPDGMAPTQPVTLYIYTYNLLEEEMPGDMGGINTEGEVVFMESVGAFHASFLGADGTEYNLAEGAKADISVALENAEQVQGEITLWSFDHEQGLWIEEEQAWQDGNRVRGQVSHFSQWNFDIEKRTPACIKVTVDLNLFAANQPFYMKVLIPSENRTSYIQITDPFNPDVLYNLPPHTDVEFYMPASAPTPFAVVNTGAPWTGPGESHYSLIPQFPYDGCDAHFHIGSLDPVEPDMAISKTAPEQIVDTGVYTLSITNIGAVAPEDSTWVLDSLPEGVRPISITVDSGWSCAVEEQDVECEYEQPFPANHTEQIIIIVEVTADSATTVENCAAVETEDDPNYDNNESCVSTVVEPKPKPNIYISTAQNGRVDNIIFKDEDILVFDPNTDSWNIYFDGSDVGLGRLDVNAFHLLENGGILMSLNKPATLRGVRYDDSDILLFTAKRLGNRTAGTFSMYFDGSDVKLNKGGEDIDAITFAPNGDLVISILGNGNVGFAVKDEDLIRFEDTSLGNNTSGTWHRFFDGSDIDLTTSGEDVSAVWIDKRNEEIHFSTLGNFNINSLGTTLKGDNEDIVICSLVPNPQENTECRFDRFWNGDDYRFNRKNIDGYSGQPYSSRRAGPTVIFSIDGDPDDGDTDNEPDVSDTQDDDVLEEEDIKAHIYLPLVNQ